MKEGWLVGICQLRYKRNLMPEPPDPASKENADADSLKPTESPKESRPLPADATASPRCAGDPASDEANANTDADGRRDFFAKAGSVCAGCVLLGIPIAAGVPVILEPLKEGGTGEADFLKVTSLDALPADGTPLLVTVRADKQDAWSRFPDRAIGAIYVRRLPEAKSGLQAFNVVCPHLGCAVEFRPEQHDYFCKCHDSAFGFENGTQEEGSPSARGLDTLPIELRNENEVWVQFQNFHTGKKQKIPV